jgi:hypothetical protein
MNKSLQSEEVDEAWSRRKGSSGWDDDEELMEEEEGVFG